MRACFFRDTRLPAKPSSSGRHAAGHNARSTERDTARLIASTRGAGLQAADLLSQQLAGEADIALRVGAVLSRRKVANSADRQLQCRQYEPSAACRE